MNDSATTPAPVRIEVFSKLFAMMGHPAWRDLLTRLGPDDVPQLVAEFLSDQPPELRAALDLAAREVGTDCANPTEGILGHQFSCFMREARALSKSEVHRRIRFEGIDAVKSLGNVPVVVLCPMTLMTADAMAVIDNTANFHFPGRKVITYGEDMELFLEQFPDAEKYFAANRDNPMIEIISTLRDGGLFFTYCDFNYASHKSVTAEFANRQRAFSLGFVRIIQFVKPVLAPAVMIIDGSDITVRISKPITDLADAKTRPDANVVASLVASITENLIRQAGMQWLLLPTLCFESPELG